MRSSLNFCILPQVCCCDWLGFFGLQVQDFKMQKLSLHVRSLVSLGDPYVMFVGCILYVQSSDVV